MTHMDVKENVFTFFQRLKNQTRVLVRFFWITWKVYKSCYLEALAISTGIYVLETFPEIPVII